MSQGTFTILFVCIGFIILSTPFLLIKYWQEKRQFEKFLQMNPEQRQVEMIRIQGLINKYKTSHLLHAVLTLFCLGLWIIPWILISSHNASYRAKYEKLSNSLIDSAKKVS